MKKQILFLAMFTLALIFAGTSNVFAQPYAVPGTEARPVPCADPANPNPLTPVAGIPYSYETNVTPVGTDAIPGSAYWFVTTSINFITNDAFSAAEQAVGGTFLGAAATLGANATGTPTNPNPQGIDITWKSEGLSTVDYTTAGLEVPLFVGVMYTAPADACATNNIQVWRIEPIIAFSLDIINVAEVIGTPNTYTPGTFDTDMPQCFALVHSATYSIADDAVIMDYGINTLFFEVIAANFSTSWDGWFKLTGLLSDASGTQTADVYWGYTPQTTTNLIGSAGTADITQTSTDAITFTTSETTTATGVSIYVKVVVHNNGYEGLSDTPIILAVDGTDSAGNDDVEAATGCPDEAAFADASTQTLEKRPTIDNEVPTPFETKKE